MNDYRNRGKNGNSIADGLCSGEVVGRIEVFLRLLNVLLVPRSTSAKVLRTGSNFYSVDSGHVLWWKCLINE